MARSDAEHQRCENPLCGRQFRPRKKGRAQKYCTTACKKAAERLIQKLGRKLARAFQEDLRPIIRAEMEAQRQAGTGKEARP